MKKTLSFAALVACALCFVFSSCSKRTTSDNPLCGEWYIGAYNADGMQDLSDKQYRVLFNADSTFYCATDCNSFHSRYTVEGDSLRLGGMASTMMACPEMEVERRMGFLLSTVRTFHMEDTTVYLRDAHQQTQIILHKHATPTIQ